MSKLVNEHGELITNKHDKYKAKSLSRAITALAMHAHLVAKKLDEDLLPIPKSKINEQVTNLLNAIEDNPTITLYIGFGLYIAMNPEDVTGIKQEETGEAFNRYMKILNSIEGGD